MDGHGPRQRPPGGQYLPLKVRDTCSALNPDLAGLDPRRIDRLAGRVADDAPYPNETERSGYGGNNRHGQQDDGSRISTCNLTGRFSLDRYLEPINASHDNEDNQESPARGPQR
jgi:hypothetical protein